MTGSATPAPDAGAPATDMRARLDRRGRPLQALAARRTAGGRQREVQLARILDLFEEHVYAGEITPDGRYVHHVSPISVASLIGGARPGGGLVEGSVADSTAYDQAAARLAEASDRFTSLLDVVGAHVPDPGAARRHARGA